MHHPSSSRVGTLLLCLSFLLPSLVHAQIASFKTVQNLSRGFEANEALTAAALDPNNPLIMYVGTVDGTIYRTRDGGQTWIESQLQFALAAAPPRARFNTGLRPAGSSNLNAHSWERGNALGVSRLNLSAAMQPLQFDPGSLSPIPSLNDFGQVGQINRVLSSSDSWINPPTSIRRWPRLLGRNGAAFEDRAIIVRWITIHPSDTRTILAGTSEGLFESPDSGDTWYRGYDHTNPERRDVRHIEIVPSSGRRYLGTLAGLMISDDDGLSYRITRHTIVPLLDVFQTTLDPRDPNKVWLATNFGAWMSTDMRPLSPENFGLPFLQRIPGQRTLRRILFAPTNPNRVVLVADEAVHVSGDGGTTFETRGYETFAGQMLKNVLFGTNPNHLIAATNRDLWQSFDAGRTWSVIFFGNGLHNILQFHEEGQGSWIVVTDDEVMRLQERPVHTLGPDAMRKLEAKTLGEPTIDEAVRTALKNNLADRAVIGDMRSMARWSHLMPTVYAEFGFESLEASFTGSNISLGSNGLNDPVVETSGRFSSPAFQVMAFWDLQSLVFNEGELPKGRIFKDNEDRARTVRDSVVSLYAERRRLQLEEAAEPDAPLRRHAMRQLRLNELTDHLNLLVGGGFGPQQDDSGAETTR